MNKEQQIFEQLRQLPPELSPEQVEQIILILPTLPPPSSSWFSFHHLNSIIMTTTIVSSIAVLSFYIFNVNVTTEIAENIPAIITKEKVEIPVEEIIDSPISLIEPRDNKIDYKPVSALAKSPIKTLNLPKNESIIPIDMLPQLKNRMLLPPLLGDTNTDLTLIKPTTKSSMLFLGEDNNFIKEGFSCDELLDIERYKMERLKEELKDLFKKRKAAVKGLTYPVHIKMIGQQIKLNEQLLSKGQSENYLELLRRYDILSCPHRVVTVGKKFIAVGDMLSKGFRGTILGKNAVLTSPDGRIDIRLKKGYQIMNTIGWGSTLNLE